MTTIRIFAATERFRPWRRAVRRAAPDPRLWLSGLIVIGALAISASPGHGFEAPPPTPAVDGGRHATPTAPLAPSGRNSGPPEILLISPRLPVRVSSPLDIELWFRAAPPAKIVPGSLRVLYGFFGFDITDRLAKHAEFTEFGIRAKNADLPAGSHDITIEISDDRDRVTRKTFKFDVGER